MVEDPLVCGAVPLGSRLTSSEPTSTLPKIPHRNSAKAAKIRTTITARTIRRQGAAGGAKRIGGTPWRYMERPHAGRLYSSGYSLLLIRPFRFIHRCLRRFPQSAGQGGAGGFRNCRSCRTLCAVTAVLSNCISLHKTHAECNQNQKFSEGAASALSRLQPSAPAGRGRKGRMGQNMTNFPQIPPPFYPNPRKACAEKALLFLFQGICDIV